ncbi:sensor histidine kinase [Robertmurraya yapensis]|uniref:Oxygen sensor histidine kinase NreB n=1 Tax=Bacillus yapensis TaxID=2492960 RepID=A0A3S0I7U5_9BACI|nr:ATP-binding protein [Bacillus yapensis]RTR27177.1 sensor histidine kinase [Bacillus yapensis]TKS94024.1 sensor histidine kinase [Bacillus yapensis]
MERLPEKKEISNYIIQSSEDEIKRIAFELHEGVGQTLYSVFTGMQLLEANMTDHESKHHVHEMNEILEKTIQEIRFLSVELHPPTLSSLGFLPALKSYLNLYKATYGILVEVEQVGQEILLPERHRIMLFRVCQEALGNIAKYADTHQVHIKLEWEKHGVAIVICDEGIGFDVEKNRHKPGLAVMYERMKLIGGNCVITSTLGKGTTIQLELPLQ